MTVRITLSGPADAEGWRRAARALLAEGVPPDDVRWSVEGESAASLFDAVDRAGHRPVGEPTFPVPPQFLDVAASGLLHCDPGRFDLFYRLLTRISRDRRVATDAADADVARARSLASAVRRDTHKMTAFVRFRRIECDGGPHFLAWFEPDHHVVEATAPFFVRRFASMRWTILTPRRSAHWSGRRLSFGDGARRCDAPDADAYEDVWRTYYASIFNPARLKTAAMRSEMPKKYWRNLPEAPLIGPLIAQAAARSRDMVAAEPTPPRKRSRLSSKETSHQPHASTIARLRAEANGCRDCPLWADATQTVFGEGPESAPVVVVGEQPGDKEDIAGRPFVGPAGAMFDRAADEAGLDRDRLYVTNAVKHFKFEPRGKIRLHKTPAAGEVSACRPWLLRELAAVAPKLVVAMGATAARSVLGRPVKIGDVRGSVIEREGEPDALVTVHPSYLLRLPDERTKRAEYDKFVADLRLASAYLDAAA